MKLGFLGFGNMAQAIVSGLLLKECLPAEDIAAYAPTSDKLEANALRFGIQAIHDPKKLAEFCDVLILACKPSQMEKATKPLAGQLKNTLIICLAWGIDNEKLEEILPGTAHLSIIPNTPIAVGQGISVTEETSTLSREQYAVYEKLFGAISLIVCVDSAHLNIAGTLAGCAPAFTEMYMEALADAGVMYGLQRKTAYELCAKMIEGVGALYLHDQQHPGKMKDDVCSPGGSTIRGVAALEKAGFRGDVIEAIEAICKKE